MDITKHKSPLKSPLLRNIKLKTKKEEESKQINPK